MIPYALKEGLGSTVLGVTLIPVLFYVRLVSKRIYSAIFYEVAFLSASGIETAY